MTNSPPCNEASIGGWPDTKASGSSPLWIAPSMAARAEIRLSVTSRPSASKKPPSLAAQIGACEALVVVYADFMWSFGTADAGGALTLSAWEGAPACPLWQAASKQALSRKAAKRLSDRMASERRPFYTQPARCCCCPPGYNAGHNDQARPVRRCELRAKDHEGEPHDQAGHICRYRDRNQGRDRR